MIVKTRLPRLILVFLTIAVLAAAFAFSAPTQAQDETYVDLAIDFESTVGWEITATNQGSADAYGVTVYIEAADQVLVGMNERVFDLSDSTTCKRIKSSKIETATCASGVWNVGHLAAGESEVFGFAASLVSTLTQVTTNIERYPVLAYAEFQDTTIPAEPEFLKQNNSDSAWLATAKDRTAGGADPQGARGEYWLEASVDGLQPQAGDTVKFSFKAAMTYATGRRDTSLRGVKLRIELSPGMGTPTATPPSGTTFAAAQGLTRTWDWDIGTFQSNTPLDLVVSTTLDNPLPAGVARSDLCLTAELTAERPDNISQRENSAEICFREDPVVLLQEGEAILWNMYPCVAVTAYPCSSDDTLEMRVAGGSAARAVGIGRDEAVLLPEKVFIQVKDPEGRLIDTQSHSVNSGTAPSWQTAREPDHRSGERTVGGVEISYTRKEFDSTQIANYSNLARTMAVTALDGGTAPGLVKVRFPGSGSAFYDLTTTGTVTKPTFGLNTVSTAVIPYFAEFSTLGTYKIDFTATVTHTDTTNHPNPYSGTGSYTFHVGPVAELEVRDNGPNPEVPADQRAFTIVAVNNGPEDAPAAQVTVTGLTTPDYVSHSASHGMFDSTTGVWSIGDLLEPDLYRGLFGHDGAVLTIITSAAVDTEITAAVTNTQDYEVCIRSNSSDVDAASESACTTEDATNTWHTTPYYDYISDNSTDVTILAKDGTGADLPALQSAQEDTASIVVVWDPVGVLNQRMVTHYEIGWSADGATGWTQLADNVSQNRYVDTGVGPGDTRYYRVRALNDRDQKGPWSQVIKGMVSVPETASAGRPEAPVLAASLPEGADGRTQIDLAWDKPVENGAPITSYTVEVADRSNGPWAAPDPAPQLGGSDTSWSHTGLTGGTRKYYRMKAANSQGDSDWSEVIDATTRAPGKAGPPVNVQAAPDGDSAIDLSWDLPADDGGSPIRYYEVQWSADGTGGWRGAGRTTDAETRTLKNTGLSFGTTRYYRVAARNGVTLGEWSDPPVSAKTLAGVPGIPGLTAKATASDTIELTWTEPADNGSPIIRYELDWSPDGTDGSWSRLTTPAAADKSYNDTGLDPGTERHYRIRAVNSATPGEGSWSTVRSAVTPPAVPVAPTLRAEPNGQNAIDVIWEPPFDDGGADVSGYELHWSADGAENSYSRLTSPSGTSRSYTHANLQPGTTRYYQLRARNSAGWGEFSQSASAITLTGVPAAPSLTVRANGASEIKLSWTKPDDRGSDIFGYHLQQSDDGNDWYSLGGHIPSDDTEYVHTGLSGGTTKHYRVRALNNNGDGQWSQVRNARTNAGGPDAPVLTLNVVDDNRIDLEWTEPADNGSSIRGYWVERSVDGNEPWERLTSNNRTTEYSDDDLYRGMTRHYRVAAFNGAGTGPYSEAKSATTTGDPATAPGTPTLFRLSEVGRNQVTIAWDPPTDDGGVPVSGYEYEAAVPCEDDPNTPENESEYNCGYGFDGGIAITGTSVTIRNLNTDGDYFFQVRAVNIIGKGEWSRDIQARLRPSTNGQVRITPTTINVNEGATVTYTIRLSTAPPHPVQVWIQPQGGGGYNDIEEAAFAYTQSLLVPNGWTHPDPDEAPYWTEFSYNWSQGVRVTFTAPEDGDADDEVAVMDHFVTPLPYHHYGPCRQEDQAERDQCRQAWDDAWANSVYQYLTGASVIVIVRDND